MTNRTHLPIKLVFLLLLAAAALTGCNAFGPSPADVELITLERQPCFGFCPVYTLAIQGDGTVEYNGATNVEVTGPQTSTIDPAAVEELAGAMIDAGYLDWEDAYVNQEVTDNAYVITSIIFADGTMKRIEHYLGDSSAPEELTELEALIDETAGSAVWVGVP